MKTESIFRMMLCVAFLVVASVNVQAQNREKQRLSREELAVKQAKHIAVDLGFDDALTKRFVDTYARCQKEIWNLRPQYSKERKKPTVSVTEEEIRKELQDRFAHSRKILDIREKYYKEYSQFMTQKQIKQIYQHEKKMMNHLSTRKKNPRKH